MDSDQPAHLLSLIRIITGHILDSQGCKVSSCRQQRLVRLRTCTGWFVFSCCHYENKPIMKILPPQKWKLSDKNYYIFFHISAQNIDCGYSLEPPRLSRNKKNNVYSCSPVLLYKVGFKGGQNYIGLFSWCDNLWFWKLTSEDSFADCLMILYTLWFLSYM